MKNNFWFGFWIGIGTLIFGECAIIGSWVWYIGTVLPH